RNRCSPSLATRSPGPSRLRGPRCRSAKWRRRVDSAQPRASLRGLTVRVPLARPLVLAFIELLEELLEAVGNSFFDDIVEVSLERCAQLALDVAPEPPTAPAGLDFVLHHRLWPQRHLLRRPGRPLPHAAMSAIILGRPDRALPFAGSGDKWFLFLHNFHPHS